MCTCLLAGRAATADGAVLLAANDDWDKIPGVLTHVPAARHAPGELYRLVGGKTIPQAPQTWGYSYTACKYSIGILDRAWAGGVNDRQVAVAGTGVSAFKRFPSGAAALEPDDVPLLILQRSTTAREGIALVGELIRQHGFTPSTLDSDGSAACFAVADPREAWWLEMAPGDHWVAVRVRDDEVSVRVNAFGTHDADLTDRENVMCSPGLADFARQQGWWDGDERHFDFSLAYGSDHSPNEWGPELDKMNLRRRWRAMCLLSGGDTPEDALLYAVRPHRPLTVEDLKSVLRDTYAGTPYDLTKVPGAGRWGDPFHDDPPDYSLCRGSTVASFVAHLRPGLPAGIMWTCFANPRIGLYFPLYTDIGSLPAACEGDAPGRPEAPSAFWAFKELAFLVQRRYAPHFEILAKEQRKYEEESARLASQLDRALPTLSPAEARSRMDALTNERIDTALEVCRKVRLALEYQY